LIASHLSSLFPSSSQINSIPVPTLRRNAPFPSSPENSDILHEHAIHASVSSTAPTGPLLVRIIHGGLILEIVPLSSPELIPVRFVFPAVLLASPQVFVVGVDALHVLAVTETGSLYRIILNVESNGQLVTDHLAKGWCREYLIKNATGTLDGLVHVQGVHCVVIGFKNGSLLRLETDYSGEDIGDGMPF
jgi:nuclear pore complex protein Nup160